MEFDYEISADDCAAASILHYKLSGKPRVARGWLFAGTTLVIVALIERERGLSPILLGAIGIWWMWYGLGSIFPSMFRKYYRKYYRGLRLEGEKYHASLNQEGFKVEGPNRSWKNPWTDVSSKGEDHQVFMFLSHGTLFIFAKRYLAEEQRQTLRMLAGLPVD